LAFVDFSCLTHFTIFYTFLINLIFQTVTEIFEVSEYTHAAAARLAGMNIALS